MNQSANMFETVRFWLQWIALGELAVCWVAWSLAFVRPRKEAAGHEKVVRAPASRWGIFLNFVGFACLFVYIRPAGFEQPIGELVVSMLLAPPCVVLVWSATRRLGKHWRYEAALSADHELVKTGAYARLRHPIYSSMLGMALATGFAYTWWPMFVAGILLFLIGIEIRVRAEDRLLEEYFQEEFLEYQGNTRAYIPLIR